MQFRSILWPGEPSSLNQEPPACLGDLHLDQSFAAMTKAYSRDTLLPLLWTPLRDPTVIRYRQAVARDLEHPTLRAAVEAFREEVGRVHRYLEVMREVDSPHFRQGWFLEAGLVYCAAVTRLAEVLEQVAPASDGLRALRAYVIRYATSEPFRALAREAHQVKRDLESLSYAVLIESGKFTVKPYEREPDYTWEVEKTFAKFRQAQVQDIRLAKPSLSGMSHIEAQILEFVARLFPEPFAALERFCIAHDPFIDPTLDQFAREVSFYLAYLDYIAPLRKRGLPFCYPEVITGKDVFQEEGFDLALAYVLRERGERVVCNDWSLQGPERILVVTGPNQGGKTTFARMVGQAHYLASLGYPVPGRRARLHLFDRIFTHFERVEDVRTLRSKLEDDLLRVRTMLEEATCNSLFILNEIFASTTATDALRLGAAILERLLDLDVIGVWVTFLDELASWSAATVSTVALVDPQDPAVRTFRVARRPADGLAYALSLAQKHGLTYEQLKERLHR